MAFNKRTYLDTRRSFLREKMAQERKKTNDRQRKRAMELLEKKESRLR